MFSRVPFHISLLISLTLIYYTERPVTLLWLPEDCALRFGLTAVFSPLAFFMINSGVHASYRGI